MKAIEIVVGAKGIERRLLGRKVKVAGLRLGWRRERRLLLWLEEAAAGEIRARVGGILEWCVGRKV